MIKFQENEMQDKSIVDRIEELKSKIEESVKDLKSSKSLYELKSKFLGRTGEISDLMKCMRDIPKEKRPEAGKIINALRDWAEERFGIIESVIKLSELKEQYKNEAIDVTLPGNTNPTGAYHPNTLIRRELISVFAGMGFTVYEGPEIENDYYNFTALNTPKDHPARDMQDTFYVTNDLLLRTQTSAGQIRVMEKQAPPIKILSPGKVFRSADDDRIATLAAAGRSSIEDAAF